MFQNIPILDAALFSFRVACGSSTMVGGGTVLGGSTVGFVELLGAVGALEFVSLTGGCNQGNSHEQKGEKFHRAAS